MKQVIKSVLGQVLYRWPLHSLVPTNAAVVVAFHRIGRVEPGDTLTVDPEMFERFCRFFKRHFDVVPLGEVVRRLESGAALNRALAITFDDGCRDNFENAAPILEKLALPATFFVVSGWIGTEIVPWWDAERGVRHPWMNWDDVRALHRRGFEIGGHTRTHVDLGIVGEDIAREEIAGGRADLEENLGSRVDLFAYPYGGLRNIVERNRLLVKAAGFRCCCSCDFGVTFATTSPFDLPRVPISSWYRTPHQFGFEMAREMTPAAA